MASTPFAPTSSTSEGVLTKLQNFVAENKKVVIGATVIAAAGVGYYVYTTGPGARKSFGDEESGASEKGDKKKRKSKKKTVKDADGPLLDERKPPVEAKAVDDVPESPRLTATDIEALPKETRKIRAQEYKARGNTAYQQRKFPLAIELYTRAIEVAVEPEAVYYSNRAACYMNVSPPQNEQVVSDCDAALKLDSTYAKALNRRANALEALGRDEEALRDFTACTILEKFKNESTSQALEKCLKKIAVTRTEEALTSREPRLPSFTFVSAYVAAFRPRPNPTLPLSSTTGDETLLLSYEALGASDYAHAFTLVNEALEQGISWPEGKAKALNLRGTFKFLIGDTAGAKEDLQESLDILPSFTQTWVKIASVHMELGDHDKAFEAFTKAISYDEKDPDIYYHRGQVHFIMQNFDAASEDYNKSTALDDTFVFSHIQYAVAQYKKGEAETAKSGFRKAMQNFPDRSEVVNYYGELLLDLQRYTDAVEKFERAIELEKKRPPPINVLPMVNKALALYQWKQDINAAAELCEEALVIDPECDAAIATLAQLYLQNSRLDDAIEMFEKHAKIARTGAELEQCFTFEYATRAQKEFAKNYPTQAKELEQMAKAMAAAQGAQMQ
ncbi:TOM (translocase of outer membrane) complex component [Tulasnella sp. 330]|nr:TOM (translocase of outer membrane) complex component [Tulasnella sp. 330]KAG8873238.1 TOM (translocase of outer membrane) complex component [Tulasnella sp. 331]